MPAPTEMALPARGWARPLCLIGMSNIGKSQWAARLRAEAGAEVIDCDRLLAQQLFPEPGAAPDLHRLAAWLGQPGDTCYVQNSALLLAAEREVMLQVLARLPAPGDGRPCVIDTGGSVIHAGVDVLQALQRQTCVIHLQATPAQREQLFARYLAEPKPLLWGDAWQPQPGEPVADARQRCYPLLLAARERAYAALAACSLPADLLSRPEGLDLLLEQVAACQRD